MIITTTPDVPCCEIVDFKGLVTGSTVQSKHLGRDFMASLKTIVGGEIAGYTEMLMEAREKAQQRMVLEAKSRGANAIVNVRFSSSAIAQGMSEILVYGTAVVLQKKEK
jgi:uncharacterized protein YbjQ (UPF0145 family)